MPLTDNGDVLVQNNNQQSDILVKKGIISSSNDKGMQDKSPIQEEENLLPLKRSSGNEDRKRSPAALIAPLQGKKKEELAEFSLDTVKQVKKTEREKLINKGAALAQDNSQQLAALLKEDTINPSVDKGMQDNSNQEELNWIHVKISDMSGGRQRSSSSVRMPQQLDREEVATFSPDTLQQFKKKKETQTDKREVPVSNAQDCNQQSDTLLQEDIINSSVNKGQEQQDSKLQTPPEVLRIPTNKAKNPTSIGQVNHDINMLTPDDINFPKLQTPTP